MQAQTTTDKKSPLASANFWIGMTVITVAYSLTVFAVRFFLL